MSRKKTTNQPNFTRSRERQWAFLAYQLGFASVRFPTLAAHLWRTAALDDDVPLWLQTETERLADVTRRLHAMIPGDGEELAGRVKELADRAWRYFEDAWGREAHREKIEERDEYHSDHCCPERMMEGSPFEDGTWAELRKAVEAYSTRLPAQVEEWVQLGTVVATAIDPRSGGVAGLRSIAILQNHLSAMRPQELLARVPADLSHAGPEGIGELHVQLWESLAGGGEQPETPFRPEVPEEDAEAQARAGPLPETSLTKEVWALAFLVRYPEMSDAEIARRVGCSRTSLYRMKRFNKAKEVLLENKSSRRRGKKFRGKDGKVSVDGIDSSDPTEGLAE